ncbi:alpha-glucosidase [Lacticaseibacillus mingshuiensis]|uniref:alpha-glucosidase n=1 Tax=Lacticaseibacillus mingshuiensis TaxID=2799574 RepID=UPI001950ED65|nr:alpha-glucosidase [Lacticaseibacillus mingshuiensis]
MAKWFDNAVIYQIYPKSFQDSNGDGIGDLAGIRRRIPYLVSLGINAVWLNPVFVSPQVDNGYDIANYFAIDPAMGTMADMEGLIDDLHQHGIHLIMDFVLNHTSDQHPWFQDAIADPKSIYRDYYLFAGENGKRPNNWGSFFGGSVWAPDPAGTGQSYFHLFDKHMPDLNWQNPEVRHTMGDVADFWLNKGVDGLRLDAFIHIAKADLRQDFPLAPGEKSSVVAEPFFANLPNVQAWLRPFCAQIRTDYPDTFLLGEAASANVNLAVDYTSKHNGLMDSVITFRTFADDASQVDPRIPAGMQPQPMDIPGFKQNQVTWQQTLAGVSLPVLYWNNHDMPRVATRYAKPGPLHDTQVKSLAMLMYLQRGIPVIYYGEELGMENMALPDQAAFKDLNVDDFFAQAKAAGYEDDAILTMVNATHKMPARGPMQWETGANSGFSTYQPWLDGQRDETRNARDEEAQGGSVLHFYQALIKLKKTPLFAGGDDFLQTTDDRSYVYERRLDGARALVAINLTDQPLTLAAPSAGATARLTAGTATVSGDQLTLSPFAGVVYVEEMED